MYALLFTWWAQFNFADACLDAGGALSGGTCVDPSRSIATLRSGPWLYRAWLVVPPVVPAVAVAAIALWIERRKREPNAY